MCNKLQTEASAGGKQEMRRNSAYRGQHVIHDPPAAVVEAITPPHCRSVLQLTYLTLVVREVWFGCRPSREEERRLRELQLQLRSVPLALPRRRLVPHVCRN